jgi:glutamine synthetase adenylyltransferase
MNTTARHDLPHDPLELRKLAFLIGESSPEQLVTLVEETMAENRRRFLRVFANQ